MSESQRHLDITISNLEAELKDDFRNLSNWVNDILVKQQRIVDLSHERINLINGDNIINLNKTLIKVSQFFEDKPIPEPEYDRTQDGTDLKTDPNYINSDEDDEDFDNDEPTPKRPMKKKAKW